MEDLFIKAATIIAVALATFSSFPGKAQQDPAPQQSATGVNPATNSTAAQLKPVSGELVGKLDSKSVKQGESVVVKTDQSLTISPGTEIPKGSRLVGHVTNVQPREDGKENSQIAIQFDRAELKDGQFLSIESVIQLVAPSVDTMNGNVPEGLVANSASQGMPAQPAMNPPAGSVNQGAAGGSRPGLPAAQPGVTDQHTNENPPAPGSIVAQNGNVAIHATAIPGLLLANDIHGLPFTSASGMLLGVRRDIHLEGGTRFVLAVAMAPQGAGSGMNR